MKQIAKWVSNDGCEWHSPEQAAARDVLHAEVALIMVPLGEHVSGHGTFVQRDAEVIAKIRHGLYAIASREGVLKWWIDGQKKDHGKTDADLIACHPSWFCRMLDGSHTPLDRAYGRMCCIDKQNREWDQPYFANKADKEPPQ